MPQSGNDLVGEGIAGPPIARTQRITALGHEAGDNTMEFEAVEKWMTG